MVISVIYLFFYAVVSDSKNLCNFATDFWREFYAGICKKSIAFIVPISKFGKISMKEDGALYAFTCCVCCICQHICRCEIKFH